MIRTFGIETVNEVKAFRHLPITLPTLWAGSTRGGDDGPRLHLAKRFPAFSRPQFERTFALECAKKNLAWWKDQADGAKVLPDHWFADLARIGHPPLAVRRLRIRNKSSGAFAKNPDCSDE